MNKKIKHAEIFENIAKIANLLPAPIYWLDVHGIVLGVNDIALKMAGANNSLEIIGKDHYSFYPKEVADTLTENNRKVIELGQTIEFEEKIVNLSTKATQYFTAIRAPLRDDNGNIIGIIGTSIEITDRKEKERLALENERLKFENQLLTVRAEEREKFRKDINNIFESIAKIANILPAPMYWLDTNGIVLGANDIALKMAGANESKNNVIGKDHYSFYPKDVADTLTENNKKVVELGQTIEFEEKIVNLSTKATQYFTAIRAPLRDNDGNIIGIIGTSIEITDRKEKEQLRIENAKYQVKEKAQQKFKKVMDVIQHAIQSYKIDTLNERIGVSLQYNELDKIKVTKREREILYFLALNKSPKEIAFILSILENKSISYGTIGAFINKQLYPKFGVFNTSQLIEKATILNLIPAILDTDSD